MKSSDIDSDYITRRTTVTPTMTDDVAASREDLQEQCEERHVAREALANLGPWPAHAKAKDGGDADFEQHKESDSVARLPDCSE